MTRRDRIREALDELADWELNEVARAAADEGHLDYEDVWETLDLSEILSYRCDSPGDLEALLAAAYNRDFDPSAPYWRWGYYGPESAHDLDYDLDELADCIDDDAECSWVRYLPSAIVDAIDEADEADGDEDFDEGDWPDDPTDYDGTDEAEEADKPTAPDELCDIEIAFRAIDVWPTIGEDWTAEGTRIVRAVRDVLSYLELPATEDNVREAATALREAGGPIDYTGTDEARARHECMNPEAMRRAVLTMFPELAECGNLQPFLNTLNLRFATNHNGRYIATDDELRETLIAFGFACP